MDKCIFCGWARRSSSPSIRFFGIPKEPGLKRVQWLYAIGGREITSKDRVCSLHFRQGRPSSDPSHEDFVPHLYLNRDTPPEIIQCLESLAEKKMEPEWFIENENYGSYSSTGLGRICRPLILQRKRKVVSERSETETVKEEVNSAPQPSHSVGETSTLKKETIDEVSNTVVGDAKKAKLQILQRPLVEAVGVKPGQTVIIKRRFPIFKPSQQQSC